MSFRSNKVKECDGNIMELTDEIMYNNESCNDFKSKTFGFKNEALKKNQNQIDFSDFNVKEYDNRVVNTENSEEKIDNYFKKTSTIEGNNVLMIKKLQSKQKPHNIEIRKKVKFYQKIEVVEIQSYKNFNLHNTLSPNYFEMLENNQQNRKLIECCCIIV